MAWTDFGSKPASVNDIRSQSFEHPLFITFLLKTFFGDFSENIVSAGGYLIIAAIGALILRAIFKGAFLPFFVFCLIVILVIVILWEYKVYNNANDRLDSEYRLIKNYHIFYCKKGFYDTVVSEALAVANDRRANVTMNLYTNADVFVNEYIHNAGKYTESSNNNLVPSVPKAMYEINCPLELSSLLREELNRYIDANVDEIIEIANHYLADTHMSHGLYKGIIVLELVEGNAVINSLLSNLNRCLQDLREKRMLKSGSLNNELLDSIFSYDKQITIDLFNEEYRNFESIASSRSPANIVSLLSSDSYILFLWYFAVKGIKDLYDKAARMLLYLSLSSDNITMELVASENVCDQCSKMAERNDPKLSDHAAIKRMIEQCIKCINS